MPVAVDPLIGVNQNTVNGANLVTNAGTISGNAWQVGPGVAPQAALYAVRVFGCEGSTDVVVDASGHPASFAPSLALLRDGGTIS